MNTKIENNKLTPVIKLVGQLLGRYVQNELVAIGIKTALNSDKNTGEQEKTAQIEQEISSLGVGPLMWANLRETSFSAEFLPEILSLKLDYRADLIMLIWFGENIGQMKQKSAVHLPLLQAVGALQSRGANICLYYCDYQNWENIADGSVGEYGKLPDLELITPHVLLCNLKKISTLYSSRSIVSSCADRADKFEDTTQDITQAKKFNNKEQGSINLDSKGSFCDKAEKIAYVLPESVADKAELAAQIFILPARIKVERRSDLRAQRIWKLCQKYEVERKQSYSKISICPADSELWEKFFLESDLTMQKYTDEEIAKLLVSLRNITLRDAVMIYVLFAARVPFLHILEKRDYHTALIAAGKCRPDFWQMDKSIRLLESLSRFSAPQDATMFSVLGYLYWWCGQNLLAKSYIQSALQDDEHYSLARLVKLVLEKQLPPPYLTHLLELDSE